MSRFIALDAFRGFTIAAMILVNTPGSRNHVYAPLKHASWHGWTPTDLVFPFFLFIVGSAMFFSLSSQKNSARNDVVLHIVKRGFILFAIGLVINALALLADPSSSLRIMGVLQRIGIVYVIASLMACFLGRQSMVIAALLLLVAYWALLSFTGGFSVEKNLVQDLDLALLGASNMWELNGRPFDPEGLLSTFPAIVNTLIGFLVTSLLVEQNGKLTALKIIVPLGLALVATGLIWNIWFPINKPLWTSSYAVFTSGVAVVLLALFIWLVDILKVSWIERPCVIYGQNALFIYVLSICWPGIIAYAARFKDHSGNIISGNDWLNSQLELVFSPINASLAFALIHVVLFWLIAFWLYRKNILIKI